MEAAVSGADVHDALGQDGHWRRAVEVELADPELIQDLVGQRPGHARVLEVVAPDLLAGLAVQLEQEAVVADEVEVLLRGQHLSVDRTARHERPYEPAVADPDRVQDPSGRAHVGDAASHRGRGEDRAAELGLPFGPRALRKVRNRNFGGKRVRPAKRCRGVERQVCALEGIPPKREGHGVFLVDVGGAVARDDAGQLEAVEVEDRLVDVSLDLALLVALELERQLDAVLGKAGGSEPPAFDRISSVVRARTHEPSAEQNHHHGGREDESSDQGHARFIHDPPPATLPETCAGRIDRASPRPSG